MPTPSLQTLVTDAQQVLNLDSISAVRSVVAVALANANTGTPLNPNLTTQQLWNEFYQVVTKPKSDIESIIANQLMKFLYAPPAPGGVGANGQVIFNDNGVLAGDPQFLWNKTTNLLTITGAATITGDLTVDTNVLKVDSLNNRVGILTATPAAGYVLDINGALRVNSDVTLATSGGTVNGYIFGSGSAVYYRTASTNSHIWQNGGTQLAELNSSGNLGLGVTPSAWATNRKALQIGGSAAASLALNGTSNVSELFFNSFINTSANNVYAVNGRAGLISFGSGGYTFGIDSGTQTAGANCTFTSAMTLEASGSLSVGATSALNSVKIFAERSGGSVAGFNRTTSDGTNVLFYRQGSIVGDVSVTTTGTTFNSTSDYRLKENVQPLVGGLARVSALKPSIYKWKANGSAGEGFLAHELAEVVPAAVSGEKDAVNADGSIKAQSIDMSRVVPILVAAIQELAAEVNALKNA